MNNRELEELLRKAQPPGRSPEFWEELPRRIGAKLNWRQHRCASQEPVMGPPWWRWAIGGAFALLCLIIGFAVGDRHGEHQAKSLLQNEKFVREVLTMFPNQVIAIVQDEQGLRISLAEQPDVLQSQPLWIKVCEGNDCRLILTFSGQTVQIDGYRVEALADSSGGVLLVGEHFVWSSDRIEPVEGVQIEARQLREIL